MLFVIVRAPVKMGEIQLQIRMARTHCLQNLNAGCDYLRANTICRNRGNIKTWHNVSLKKKEEKNFRYGYGKDSLKPDHIYDRAAWQALSLFLENIRQIYLTACYPF